MSKGIVKRFLSVFIVFALSFSAIPSFAAGEVIIPVYLDGKQVDFGSTYGKKDNAIILYDYAYVPIAQIVEILTGARPAWDDTAKTSTFDFNGKRYVIDTSRNGIFVDNVFVPSATGTPPVIVNDRMLIPLKMLSTVMGFGQVWNESTRSTYLTSPAPQVPQPKPPVVTPVPPIAVLPPTVNKVTADKTTVTEGDSVHLTINANTMTFMVRVTDQNNNVLKETRAYAPRTGEHVFELDFKPPRTGKYTVYAGDSSGYPAAGAKELNVTVNAPAQIPVISELKFDAAEIRRNQSSVLTVTTSPNVTSVSYTITQGGGYFESYTQTEPDSENRNRRVFTNKYTASNTTGDVRVTVTAVTETGHTVTQTATIRVTDSNTANVLIYDINYLGMQGYTYEPGERIVMAVATGLETNQVTVSYNQGAYLAEYFNTDNDYHYWIITFAAGQLNNMQAVISSVNTKNTSVTDSKSINIPVYEAKPR